jgi:hypothetical protein
MGKYLAATCLFLLPLSAFDAHHRVTLKNGNTHSGQFISGTSTQIVFQDENGSRRRFSVADVAQISFDDASTTSTFGRDTLSDRRYPADDGRSRDYRTSAERRSTVDSRMIPANTEISVRTNENIESRTASEGRTYSAAVYKDVTDASGNVVIPRGADAQLVIREMKEGGTVRSPELVLDLQSVRFDGRNYLISTRDLEQSEREGIGKNRRTAEMVGGGAALGGLLGAIAGGGKGAVIGAIAGAAAGGAVQVLTKGKEVRVPAETVLTFKVDEPAHLELMR